MLSASRSSRWDRRCIGRACSWPARRGRSGQASRLAPACAWDMCGAGRPPRGHHARDRCLHVPSAFSFSRPAMPASWPRPEHPTDMATRAAGLSPGLRQQLEMAARSIRDGALAPARQVLDAVLAEAPAHPEALRLLGILHTRGRQYGAARDTLGEALRQWPDDPLALTDLANAEQAAGDVDAALAHWREACALAPDYPMGWFNLGRNLQVLGHTEPAVEA